MNKIRHNLMLQVFYLLLLPFLVAACPLLQASLLLFIAIFASIASLKDYDDDDDDDANHEVAGEHHNQKVSGIKHNLFSLM